MTRAGQRAHARRKSSARFQHTAKRTQTPAQTVAAGAGDWRELVDGVHAMSALDLLCLLPDNSIDLILCDPPYGHNNNNNGDLIHRWEVALARPHVGVSNPRPIANDGIEANDLFKACLPEFKRVLKKGACCCCGGGGGPDPQFARWSLWMDEVLEFKQMVVWDKGPMGMGWHYRRSYETVLVAQKQGAACKWYDTSNAVENIIRPAKDVAKIIPRADQHPTEKPVGLMEHFIRLHTQEGDIVLDPFAGSGSTLVAAHKLGRRYIGCDVDETFVGMATKRLRDSDPYQPTELAEGVVQHSLFAA